MPGGDFRSGFDHDAVGDDDVLLQHLHVGLDLGELVDGGSSEKKTIRKVLSLLISNKYLRVDFGLSVSA